MIMEEYENCIVKFGKFRGYTYKYVAENHFIYVMHTYHKNKNIEEEFRQYLKEYLFLDPTKDPLLNNAWYQDPRAEVLQRLDLEPNLFEEEDSDEDEESDEEEEDLESVTTSKLTKQEYISKLDQELIKEQGADLIIGKSFGNNMYLLLPEVVNSALALHKKFLENRRSDMRYIELGIPSKVITRYWVTCKTPNIEKTPGYKLLTGKWMLFFDRINENEFGLTDFDIRFQLLRDNITNLNIIFKVSTRRPSPTSSSDRTGEKRNIIRKATPRLVRKNIW
ncbi:unnamed protein product [Clavelina lepadiformis]|uniref:TF-B3 domain-containing protein n=1 Tax=Clavelina lepadiformis TaxID=159417 RepID=A0ABP0GZP6_CLALP